MKQLIAEKLELASAELDKEQAKLLEAWDNEPEQTRADFTSALINVVMTEVVNDPIYLAKLAGSYAILAVRDLEARRVR